MNIVILGLVPRIHELRKVLHPIAYAHEFCRYLCKQVNVSRRQRKGIVVEPTCKPLSQFIFLAPAKRRTYHSTVIPCLSRGYRDKSASTLILTEAMNVPR